MGFAMGVITGSVRETISGIPDLEKRLDLGGELVLALYLAPHKRPDSLKVDAQDVTGARFKLNLSGLPARVFQHEYDHLQGILFFDKMSDEVLDSIREDLQAMEERYEEKTGFPSPERIDARRRRKAAVGFGKS